MRPVNKISQNKLNFVYTTQRMLKQWYMHCVLYEPTCNGINRVLISLLTKSHVFAACTIEEFIHFTKKKTLTFCSVIFDHVFRNHYMKDLNYEKQKDHIRILKQIYLLVLL